MVLKTKMGHPLVLFEEKVLLPDTVGLRFQGKKIAFVETLDFCFKYCIFSFHFVGIFLF